MVLPIMYLTTTSSSCLAAVILLFTVQVAAFWRMPCLSRSGLARIDPLVSFGTASEHAHYIHGSSAFSETSTYDDLVAGNCTSCQVSQDLSAYWTPALYFQDADTGEFTLVEQEGGMLAYYLIQTDPNNLTEFVHGFPAGFQMIAGDTFQRNFTYPVPDIQKSLWTGEFAEQKFLRQAALGFNCLNYAIAPEPSLFRHSMPDKAYIDANCKNGVRLELMFPSCWNGEKDSPDHKSHVAYPTQVMTGTCPPEFPQRLISLFYETIVLANQFPGRNGQFVFANGDPTGLGYHGDFIMGWDETLLQNAATQCRNLSGEIQDCALFDIQSSDVYSNCNIKEPSSLASEKVAGTMNSLPGNVDITPGPAYAKGSGSGPAPAPAPDVKVASASPPAPAPAAPTPPSPASSETEPSGAVFQAASEATPSAEAAPAPDPTPAPAPPSVETPLGKSFFSTEYKTSGATVNEILWVEELVTVTLPYTAVTTATSLGGESKKRHLHRHREFAH